MHTNFTITLCQFSLLEQIKELIESSVHWLVIKSKDTMIRMSLHMLSIFCMGGKMKLEDPGTSWIHYHHYVSESHSLCLYWLYYIPLHIKFPPGADFVHVTGAQTKNHKTNIKKKTFSLIFNLHIAWALFILHLTSPPISSPSPPPPLLLIQHPLLSLNSPIPLRPEWSQFGAVTFSVAPLSLQASYPFWININISFSLQQHDEDRTMTTVKNVCDMWMPPFCLLFYS